MPNLLRWHVCRVNFARKIFFELRIFLRKMPEISPEIFEPLFCGSEKIPQNSRQISHQISQISLRKIKKNSPTSFCRSAGRKIADVPKLLVLQIARICHLKTIGFDTLLGAKEPPKLVPELLVHQNCKFWKSPELAILKLIGFDIPLCVVEVHPGGARYELKLPSYPGSEQCVLIAGPPRL